MSDEILPAEVAERPQSAFGSRHAVLDKDGKQLRGFTKESFHESHWTPARREEQRQKMLALHAAGKAGGQNGFHKRRSKKFQEIVAEMAQERAEEIWRELESMIFDQTKDKRLKLEAIRDLARYEEFAVKNSREDEKELRKLSGAQLDVRLLEMVGEAMGIDFTAFAQDMQQPAINGTCTDVEPCEACDAEGARVVQLLRDSGVEDDELIEITASRARCEDHREEM